MSDKGKGGSTKKKSAFGILVVGVILGVVLWGGFNWTLELTNTEEFCVSCHEMESMPYEELQETIHWSNRTGVRATCPDCHVPRPWIYKLVRKIQASNELYHHFVTKAVDTPEKFEAKRFELAQNVWKAMKETDSRECRNCHDYSNMDLAEQSRSARSKHGNALDNGQSCIDCHKGIAHELPDEPEEADEPDGAATDAGKS